MARRCTVPHQMLHAAASATAAGISQILRGEDFAVVDISGGWAWGYTVHDHYVGYVPADVLDEEAAPTHVVDQRAALIFTAADPRSPVLGVLPMGARFPAEAEGDFLKMPDGYVHRRHATPIGSISADPATLAERLIGMPYLWGGRGGSGIDCSGLVQVAFGLAGTALPRDSDQQRVDAGTDIAADEPLRRGDLIFMPDHVAIMIDAENIVHANGHAMAVAVEPLSNMVARHAQNGGAVLARRRLS